MSDRKILEELLEIIPKWAITLFVIVCTVVIIDASFITKERRELFSFGFGPASHIDAPQGSVLLFATECPEKGFIDITENLKEHYLFADISVTDGAKTYKESGAHEHNGGKHGHEISGSTNELGAGSKVGPADRPRQAPRADTTLKVSGTAHESSHHHDGGGHGHNRAGFRLCRAT
ncbi:hypothetical protein [Neptuniibacter sp.]|uniref:hypothetical protein n=1 Tax=Neptuniibacter sp. TaxID=1962643 RepID=UPI00261D3617|nr:hypothetical protein [Neptuniibacter sp.]MCP4597856.1 hypothetical protein [Neptuniibacter sp.]